MPDSRGTHPRDFGVAALGSSFSLLQSAYDDAARPCLDSATFPPLVGDIRQTFAQRSSMFLFSETLHPQLSCSLAIPRRSASLPNVGSL